MSARNFTGPGKQRLHDQKLGTPRGKDEWPPRENAQFGVSAKPVRRGIAIRLPAVIALLFVLNGSSARSDDTGDCYMGLGAHEFG